MARKLEPFSTFGWSDGPLRGRSAVAVKKELINLINLGMAQEREGPLFLLTPDGKAFHVKVVGVELIRKKHMDINEEDEYGR